jgi:hypothetical protein
MARRTTMYVMGLAALATAYLIGTPYLSAQQRAAELRVAAVPGERGGQDIFGPYEVQADWPQELTTLPGHADWTWGAGQSVFAESPNRVFLLQRGELPNMKRPMTTKIAPSIEFPIGRLPWRDATSAALPGNGGTGQLAEEGIQAWEKSGKKIGVDARWEHTIMVFDGAGKMIDSWNQWDSMLQRPHQVIISPYDAQKHVWIVDDHKHAIHKFTNDGKTKVQTIGTYGVPGADGTHFNRPAFMDFFPDGSFVVSDGYNGSRVAKFDKDGKFIKEWGQRGENGKETRPGYWNNVHGIAVHPKTLEVFVNDRGNRRIQVFDKDGKYLREWSVGAPPSDVHLIHIFSDGNVWAADRGTNKMVKWDPQGNFMYAWGTWGDFPGGMWGVHDFSVDQEGNVYVAEVDNGGGQKYRPRKGANAAMMIAQPLRAAWK